MTLIERLEAGCQTTDCCACNGDECMEDRKEAADRLRKLEAVREMLEVSRDAIAQAPEDAFGSVPPAHDHPGYWIRDELVDRITKALADCGDE